MSKKDARKSFFIYAQEWFDYNAEKVSEPQNQALQRVEDPTLYI